MISILTKKLNALLGQSATRKPTIGAATRSPSVHEGSAKKSVAQRRAELNASLRKPPLPIPSPPSKICAELASPPAATPAPVQMTNKQRSRLFMAEQQARKRQDRAREELTYRDDLNPYEYEQLCARILKYHGWDTRVTQASGDQGVDVIAEKAGFKVAIQAKKYSSPVGNAAVQEVHAGMSYYEAHQGAVVSNSGFTRSAKLLADRVGVLLLHHDELVDLIPKRTGPKLSSINRSTMR